MVIHSIETVLKRIFPGRTLNIERAAQGNSTHVYRITSNCDTFYVRILPEEGASFAPEVAAHMQLRRMRVKVPEVIYFEPLNDLLQRSIMITTEIRGQSVRASQTLSSDEAEKIMREAGRDLALINSVAVDGFGWIRRDDRQQDVLRAQWPTYRAFVGEFWESDLAYLGGNIISAGEKRQLERVVQQYDSWLDVERASLAHGDLDTTHIYQEHGCYSGIIDFGEIRGADRWYDLGHFHLHVDQQRLPGLEAALVSGYGEMVASEEDLERHIHFASLLIAVRALARSLQKRPANWYTQYLTEMLRRDLAVLL